MSEKETYHIKHTTTPQKMSPQSSSSAPDADLQLAEQDSAGRHPNAFTTRVEEADTSISYGRGGAGNLRNNISRPTKLTLPP